MGTISGESPLAGLPLTMEAEKVEVVTFYTSPSYTRPKTHKEQGTKNGHCSERDFLGTDVSLFSLMCNSVNIGDKEGPFQAPRYVAIQLFLCTH